MTDTNSRDESEHAAEACTSVSWHGLRCFNTPAPPTPPRTMLPFTDHPVLHLLLP
jgi:hypothetical protein